MIINPTLLKHQQKEFHRKAVSRAMTWSESTLSPIGPCNFFDRCTDELMSLHFSGQLPLLDWMGFEVTDVHTKTFEFITYVRAARENGSATVGYLNDPCEEPEGWELGSEKLTIEDFGMYGRLGPVRKVMQPTKYCDTDPRRRLDGTVVDNETEWDMRWTTDVILQDISRDVIVGNRTSNAGQMNGLESLVKTGYSASGALDSIVIDWNGNSLSGGSGVTWNGSAVSGTWDFVNMLRHAVRRVRRRISWSPTLRNQTMQAGDMILLMPTHMAECLLDFYTCWSVCASTDDIQIQLQSLEARRFRDSLEGGLYGFGTITIEQIPIPILAYDWGLLKSETLSDVYLLTGGIGSVRFWAGEHLSAEAAVRLHGQMGYFSTDGGRLLGVWDNDNQCIRMKLWMHPRMYTRAPWAQVRFQNVRCTTPMGPMSPDPEDTSFYYLSSFNPAVCP